MGELKDIDFGKRASSYDDGIEGWASKKFYNLLLREVKLEPGASILDVGCGTGALLSKFAGECDIKGYGIDISEKMIEQARRKCPQMTFQIARCDEIPFADQTFDIMTSCMAYHHYDNKEGFAKEAARVLKPGGVLYIADPRFPWLVRKSMNGIFRLFRIAGAFDKPQEIEARFTNSGFTGAGFVLDGFAQLVRLKRNLI